MLGNAVSETIPVPPFNSASAIVRAMAGDARSVPVPPPPAAADCAAAGAAAGAVAAAAAAASGAVARVAARWCAG